MGCCLLLPCLRVGSALGWLRASGSGGKRLERAEMLQLFVGVRKGLHGSSHHLAMAGLLLEGQGVLVWSSGPRSVVSRPLFAGCWGWSVLTMAMAARAERALVKTRHRITRAIEEREYYEASQLVLSLASRCVGGVHQEPGGILWSAPGSHHVCRRSLQPSCAGARCRGRG